MGGVMPGCSSRNSQTILASQVLWILQDDCPHEADDRITANNAAPSMVIILMTLLIIMATFSSSLRTCVGFFFHFFFFFFFQKSFSSRCRYPGNGRLSSPQQRTVEGGRDGWFRLCIHSFVRSLNERIFFQFRLLVFTHVVDALRLVMGFAFINIVYIWCWLIDAWFLPAPPPV